MNRKAFFEMLGAPLKNPRWSWGAVRSKDGTVFLQVWNDKIRSYDGSEFVQVSHRAADRSRPERPGNREREEHLSLIRNGAPSYLIIGEAVDPTETTRKIKHFNDAEVFPGGRVVEIDGEVWIELLPGVAVETVLPAGRRK